MTKGLSRTLQVLTETRNEAALEILLSGLSSTNAQRATDCLRTLLARRSEAGHLEIVRRWHTFDDHWRSLVAEKSTRIEGAMRAAILCTDPDLHQNACDAVVYLHGYDLIPTLIIAAEDKGNPQAPLAGRAVISLCELLYHELTAPRDYRQQRDPALVRQYIFPSLEKAVEQFEQHRRAELVEAFLILAQPEEESFKALLRDQLAAVHAATTNILAYSQRPGIMKLALRCLDDHHPPAAIFGVLARRSDLVFLRLLFRKFSGELSPCLKVNCRKIDSFVWLRDDMEMLRALADDELRGAVHAVVASGINRLRVFDVLKFVLRHSGPLARRAASAALATFKGNAANELVLSAVDDPDPEVQANAVRQLRDRGIPGVMPRLVECVDSPHAAVREAARQSLSEFNFQRYLSAFEMLDHEVRRCSGNLVLRVDPQAMEQLEAELSSTSRARRLRGIEVAMAMGVVPQVERHILELAQDNDHFVRAEAARALVQSTSEKSRKALDELLNDRSVSVQEAAQQALAEWPPNRSRPSFPVPPAVPRFDSGSLPLPGSEATT